MHNKPYTTKTPRQLFLVDIKNLIRQNLRTEKDYIVIGIDANEYENMRQHPSIFKVLC